MDMSKLSRFVANNAAVASGPTGEGAGGVGSARGCGGTTEGKETRGSSIGIDCPCDRLEGVSGRALEDSVAPCTALCSPAMQCKESVNPMVLK